MRKILLLLAALIVGAVALSGCSSLAETKPDQVALRYTGADWGAEAEVFEQCYTPGVVEYGNPGDKIYVYPAGQRTFKFSDDPGSDAPPMKVSTLGGIELQVSGTVTFTPNFLDCDILRDFHERIGRKYAAWVQAKDDTTTTVVEGLGGWQTMLGTYLKDPVDRAVDNVSLNYNWQQLTSDPATKAKWETEALEAIPKVMLQQAGGDFWRVDSIILQKPVPPASLQDALNAQETARLNSAAAATAAEAAVACSAACQAYQLNQAMIDLLDRSGGVSVLPVPVGSSVNITAPQPGPVPQ